MKVRLSLIELMFISMKIISFCLFGKKEMYLRGAIKNAELASQIYPGWQTIFYCGDQVPQQIIDKLTRFGAHTVKVSINDHRLMSYRFLPISQPETEVLLTRDCDSRLNLREKECVDEFLQSDKIAYTCLDHCYHGGVPILGGNSGFKKEAFTIAEKDIESINAEYNSDQLWLQNHVWPLINDKTLVFDCLGRNEFTKTVPFPSRRPIDGSFVGEVFDENDIPNYSHRKILALTESKIFKLQ